MTTQEDDGDEIILDELGDPIVPIALPDDIHDALGVVLTELHKARRDLARQRREAAKERRYGRRSRFYIVLDYFLTVVATAATVIAIVAVVHSNSATQQATATRAALIASCGSSNDFKAADLSRWHVIEGYIKAQAPNDPATLAFIATIDKENVSTDAQRNCNAAGPHP